MDLLPGGIVSIDGHDPHGEWRREGDLLYIRWHWKSIDAKAKDIVYDPHEGGVMRSRVSYVQYSHVLVPRQYTAASFILTGGDASRYRGEHASGSRGRSG